MLALQPGPLQNECILAGAAVLAAHVDHAFLLIRPPTSPCHHPLSFPALLCVCHYAICRAHPCSLIQCVWANLFLNSVGIGTAAVYQSKAVSGAVPRVPPSPDITVLKHISPIVCSCAAPKCLPSRLCCEPCCL